MAGMSSSGSVTLLRRRVGRLTDASAMSVARYELEVLENRPERDGGEEGQRRNDEDGADEERDEEHTIGGEGARTGGNDLLLYEIAGHRHHRDQEEKSTGPHRSRQHQVVIVGVPAEARERAAVVASRRGKGIEDLGQAVWRALAR